MELSNASREATRQLRELIEEAALPQDALADLLGVLVLASAPLDALDAVEKALLGRLAGRLGVDGSTAPAEVAARLDAHLQSHPLPRSILSPLNVLLRDLITADGGSAQRAALIGGAASASDKVPVGQREGEGGVRLGVLGRFALDRRS